MGSKDRRPTAAWWMGGELRALSLETLKGLSSVLAQGYRQGGVNGRRAENGLRHAEQPVRPSHGRLPYGREGSGDIDDTGLMP